MEIGRRWVRDGMRARKRLRFPAMWDTENTQKMKTRLREVEQLAQGHAASKWWHQSWITDLADSKVI